MKILSFFITISFLTAVTFLIFGIFTGLVKTPLLEPRFSKLEGYKAESQVTPNYGSAAANLAKKIAVISRSHENDTVLKAPTPDAIEITEEEFNAFANIRLFSDLSFRSLINITSEPLKTLVEPFRNLRVKDVYFSFLKDNRVAISGHLDEKLAIPFYALVQITQKSDLDIDAKVLDIKFALIDFDRGLLNQATESANNFIDFQEFYLTDYRIDALEFNDGKFTYKGLFPYYLFEQVIPEPLTAQEKEQKYQEFRKIYPDLERMPEIIN